MSKCLNRKEDECSGLQSRGVSRGGKQSGNNSLGYLPFIKPTTLSSLSSLCVNSHSNLERFGKREIKCNSSNYNTDRPH